MSETVTLELRTSAGDAIELTPMAEAMIRVIVGSQTRLTSESHGVVELHFRRDNGKVTGRLKGHLALERFEG